MSIDFSTPTYLISFYHISGTISFFLNTFTIWLVIFKSDKIDNFRYFLLGFQVLCTMSDFHITFLMQPCPLFPVISGFCKGFLAEVFNVWTHYLMAALIFLIIVQLMCLAFCFLKKHQSIGRIMKRNVLPTKYMVTLIVYACGFSILVTWLFLEGVIPKDQASDFIKKNFPQYLTSFMSLENFAIYELNIWLITFAIFALPTSILGAFLIIFTVFDMFKMLKDAQSKVSTANYKRHRSAVNSLLAQFTASSFCVLPPLAFVILVISNLQYSQVIMQIVAAVLALHSPVNSAVLVASIPPYRNFVLRKKSIMPTAAVKTSNVAV